MVLSGVEPCDAACHLTSVLYDHVRMIASPGVAQGCTGGCGLQIPEGDGPG